MPIFEYSCSSCGEEFEELVQKKDEKIHCPKCGSARVKKKMSVFAHRSDSGFRASTSGSSCPPSCSATSCSTCRK